jgi:glycosyltransferase involved in cell wall biosynthesis
MAPADRRVLHVLPHAGGGGDTYVDMLEGMPGYAFTRVYLAQERKTGVARSGMARVVSQMRRHDLVHVHGEGAAGLLLPVLAIRRSVVTLHGLHLLRRVDGWKRRAAAANLHAVVRAADRTICVSHAEHDILAAVVSSPKTVVVHNGVKLSDVPAARVDLPPPVGIWVGSLDERRDPAAVVRAAERTSTSLIFAGEGPLRDEVERAGRTHVRVLGQRDDVPALLAGADFFVLMSHREGLSFALLEAMAQGLPAIVADIPENREAIGESGIAVPYGDELAVAGAMERLRDETERRRLGTLARERVAELFGAGQMVARTRAVYEAVLAE